MKHHKFPYTPFATGLSRSARETERRIRNIFSGPKKNPPLPLVLLAALMALLCGNLVSCQEAQSPDSPQQGTKISVQQGADRSAQAEPDAAPAVPVPTSDLNRNGIPEEIRLENEFGSMEVRFYENGGLLLRRQPGDLLCTLDGKDYILNCDLDEYQGVYHYSYSFADYSGEHEGTSTWEKYQWNSVSFDTNFAAPFHMDFDPEAIAAFVEEVNGLLANSVRFLERDGALLAEKAPPMTLDWLDSYPEFTRDPDKSLLENLKSFQAAMSPAWTPLPPQAGVSLPITEPLQMAFLSGAGAWQTDLTLNPDGTFTGDYCDADLNIHYVCQFHGSFRTDARLTDASWQLTLEELVLDTKYPVGQEWDEDGIHNISSEPYGFDGADGTALKPGAVFVLYSPEAHGHAPGTELYGAAGFLDWWRERHGFGSTHDTLGCWGLHNLETDRGFFTYDWLKSDS